MAQDASGAAGGTLVIPGEMAARVDRLPMSFMSWEIALLVQLGWACAGSTDGIARTLAVEYVCVHPQQLPDPDARPGHRLDRRHRPPRP